MNKEKLMGYLEQAKTTLGKISRKIWIIIGVCLAAILCVIIFLIWSHNNRPYAVLIDQANDEEFASVLTWLQEQGVTDYKTEGSSTILVPAGQATTLKARLLQQQYSSANLSSSVYFERVGALSTQRDREEASKEDIEKGLEAVIRQFSGVLSANVDVNFGEDNGYVLYKNNVVDASASIRLTMQEGKLLSTEQANAIRNYVAHAIPNLKVDDVFLTDSVGNTYTDFGSSVTGESDTILMLQVKEDLENRMRTQVTQALGKVFGGEENVAVVPNVTIELGDKTINTHDVKLPEFAQDGSTGGRGIIGSEFWIFQFVTPDEGAVGGVVGTTTNADLPTYVEPGEAQAELQAILEEEANRIYDNSYEDIQMIVHCATIADVSMAVWINGGAYNDPADIPSEETVRNWAAAAANIQPVITDDVTREQYLNWKISVATDPFVSQGNEPEPENPYAPGTVWGIPYWVFIAAGVGLLVFVVVLVLILVLRGKKRKKEEAERQALIETMEAAALPGQIVQLDENGQPVYVNVDESGEVVLDEEGNPVTGANVMDLHTEKSMELRQSIRDFVDENMEVAALLLKSWMKEGGENG